MAAASSHTDRWSQLSEADDEELITVGRIHGLRARADLNGKYARAVRFIQSKGRWALVVDGGEKVLVKDENVDFSAAPADSSMADAENQPVQTGACPPPPYTQCTSKSPAAELKQAPLGVPVSTADALLAEAKPSPLPVFLQCLCLPFGGARANLTETTQELRAA